MKPTGDHTKPPWYKNGGVKVIGSLLVFSFAAGGLHMQIRVTHDMVKRNAKDIKITRNMVIKIAIELGINVMDQEAK